MQKGTGRSRGATEDDTARFSDSRDYAYEGDGGGDDERMEEKYETKTRRKRLCWR